MRFRARVWVVVQVRVRVCVRVLPVRNAFVRIGGEITRVFCEQLSDPTLVAALFSGPDSAYIWLEISLELSSHVHSASAD